ncbi:hypothetical protein F7725_020877 [Dissostichus mawsoni]|uniref:Transposable element P transposase-like C-terminal domain-containing protein n=1 Tax=Dissostichus mawsoni TaxID=36200 RepID=A0A7J5YGE1_DISMA|nr:hypothetical protein F7725_020877 [Dissostichus mawsoni]
MRPLKRNSEMKYPSCSLRLNNKNIFDLPDLQKTLCAARKKLRLKAQQTRRLKARVSSLAGVIKYFRRNSLFQPVEEIVTEDDTLANLPDVHHLSEYKEAAISYIAGFIVKKIEQKVTYMPCSYALTSADSVHPFVTLKNRGGLQKPPPGITSVFAFNIPITISIGVCYNIAILFGICYNITTLFGIHIPAAPPATSSHLPGLSCSSSPLSVLLVPA